jgi:hypothetical protein
MFWSNTVSLKATERVVPHLVDHILIGPLWQDQDRSKLDLVRQNSNLGVLRDYTDIIVWKHLLPRLFILGQTEWVRDKQFHTHQKVLEAEVDYREYPQKNYVNTINLPREGSGTFMWHSEQEIFLRELFSL